MCWRTQRCLRCFFHGTMEQGKRQHPRFQEAPAAALARALVGRAATNLSERAALMGFPGAGVTGARTRHLPDLAVGRSGSGGLGKLLGFQKFLSLLFRQQEE